MQICIDISQIVYPGGVARYARELVSNLLEIDSNNEYILFGSSLRQQKTLKKFITSLKPKNSHLTPKLYPIPPTVLEFIFNQIHFSIDPFIGKVDVLHTSDWTEPKSKAAKVTTIHDLAVFKFPKQFHQKIVEVHKRKLEWVRSECAKIIAVSENTKTDIIEFLKIPPEKIVVIYEAASKIFQPKSRQEQEKIKNKFGVKKNYILTVATKGARKNLARLFETFGQLRKDFDLNLVVVGDIEVSNGRDFIVTGFLADEDLAVLYSGSKVFVYPSLYEGFGLPVVEAMACGTPVVCSNISSLPEVGGKAAVYVNPTNTGDIQRGIKMVLNLPGEEYLALKKKSLEQAREFSWEKTAQQTLKLYQEVVNS